MKPIVRIEKLSRTYKMGKNTLHVLKKLDISVNGGEFVGIMGQSGSGKSTLLNILGLLDRPTSGKYHLENIEVAGLSDDKLSEIRNLKIGFVFQSFNLFPHLSVEQNIETPMIYAEMPLRERRKRAAELAKKVGLGHRLGHRPTELSGGECQRTAIARALSNNPTFLLADEPTGNLDQKTSCEIISIFKELNSSGVTIIMVTHNPELKYLFHKVILLKDGEIVSE